MAAPELCVVVLSRGEPNLVAAVSSLLGQSEPAEIVVAHSGAPLGQDPGVPVVHSPTPLKPGGARNAGVRATSAPYVAFLAADNRARPGWIEGRLRRHRDGAAAVGTAMALPRGNAPALATHLLWHSSRMPHRHPDPIMRFGASYSRALLERHGPFPDDIPREEDVVFNRRLLAAGVAIAWAPEVQTEAIYPRTARELVAEQLRRGRLRRGVQGQRPRVVLAGRALADAPEGLLRGARGDVSSRELAVSAPLVAAGALAAVAGVLSAGRRSPRSDRTPAPAESAATAPPPAPR